MIFYRTDVSRQKTDCTPYLVNSQAGTEPSACWIIGSGPSLSILSEKQRKSIQTSCAGRFAVNYAGRGKDGEGWLIRCDNWTSFDPTASFSRSVFLDPSIRKFVRAGREMDLVPESSFKVCDCPETYFINCEHKTYTSFFGQGPIHHSLDSLLQAMDIAVRLGYRHLYLIGTEMVIRPSPAQIAYVRSKGLEYDEESGTVTAYTRDTDGRKNNNIHQSDLLSDLVKMVCQETRLQRKQVIEELSALDREKQYSFDETKSFQAAMSSDQHYWDRVQYLRLARKSLSLQGIKIVSCTPRSRLNAFFPYQPCDCVVQELAERFGSAEQEATFGKYQTRKHPNGLPYHKDIPPYSAGPPKKKQQKPKAPAPKVVVPVAMPENLDGVKERVKALINNPAVTIKEEG